MSLHICVLVLEVVKKRYFLIAMQRGLCKLICISYSTYILCNPQSMAITSRSPSLVEKCTKSDICSDLSLVKQESMFTCASKISRK